MPDFNFSVFTGPQDSGVDGSELTDVLERALHASGEADRWAVSRSGIWCCLTPPNHAERSQGWKLHLSATVSSAPVVLERALPVLLGSDCGFKFASTLANVGQLNARHTPRGHSGKFITIYPSDDDEAVSIAGELHRVTMGLAGPRVLSDRPYAPESLVHYRYGAFVEERRLSNDGLYTWVIFDPDGNPVEDRRGGRYSPPSWARCPFPSAEDNAIPGPRSGDAGVLVGDRFLVKEAIRHLNKGGVYRAVDTETGCEAILKEARPHVGADGTGRDVRDHLRAEAKALEVLGPRGAAPRMLALFEQGSHLFLAEELVPGMSLREWVLERIRHSGWRRQIADALQMAGHLVELMTVAHSAGLILRDFNPNNIMVRPDGELRLIDLELAVCAGEPKDVHTGAGTPGYSAPEQMAGASAAIEADYFSLGASICFLVTGSGPDFLSEVPESRPWRERLAEWLAVRADLDSGGALRTLILRLMDDEPERRWNTAGAARVLAEAREPGCSRGRTGHLPEHHHHHRGGDGLLGTTPWQEVIEGSVDYLLASMNSVDHDRLWAASCGHGAADPCAIQLGAAGVLGVLTRYYMLTGDPRLPRVIATAGDWIIRRLDAEDRRSPGLYFGTAGIAWSLYDAARALRDDRMAQRALTVAQELPVSSDNPDLTHGTAGIGLTFLHLWMRTGNEEFARCASKSANELVAAATEEPSGISWGTPAAFDSKLAGGRYHGFAHGTAGVGYVLLATGLATGRSDCLELAYHAGETLLANAMITGGIAQWGAGPGDDPTAPYWCHGSAGIGTFLIRLYGATADPRFRKLADLSAQAVMENSWRGVLGQCHGLAGNGDFLLDMADITGDERYVAMARQIARIILASRARHEDQIVFPDERGNPSAIWADGVSGIVAFLMRLRHRSARLWMVDQPWERGLS